MKKTDIESHYQYIHKLIDDIHKLIDALNRYSSKQSLHHHVECPRSRVFTALATERCTCGLNDAIEALAALNKEINGKVK